MNVEVSGEVPSGTASVSVWGRLDAFLERLGDRLNPILVKEARQALKSRQFLLTFSLMLLCGWAWSMLSASWNAGSIDATRSTAMVFMGYLVILVVPTLIIVPFSAFQSLAAERNEGTFELLWISSLASHQIVLGKLATAVLQAMVFFSALAPCIAFTYLLRGLDIVTIGFTLTYTVLVCLLFCCLALMLATLTRVTQLNVLVSALLVVGLVIWAWAWMFIVGEAFVEEGAPFDEPLFWVVNACIVSFMISFMILFVTAAAAQMSFAADNHSTRLRIVMLGQQVLFVSWVVGLFAMNERVDMGDMGYLFPVAAAYWAITGGLMTGELAELSPRARRSLPRTALGRVFCTWFNPGSGTGYVFALTNLAVCYLTITAAAAGRGGSDLRLCLVTGCLLWGYVAFYLGMGSLLIRALRRRVRFGPMAGLMVQCLLASGGILMPMTFQLSMYRIFSDDYTMLQMPNWGWSLVELFDNWQAPSSSLAAVTLVVPIAGAVVFVLNLFAAAREVAQTRLATPQRVLDDSAPAA